ncbi:MAG: winged helix-turn-helix transcriptional regulator [Thermoplasmata archaeon]|nr:winged helix-turn-helix transcriptional regulator [Thermoplasmatales archaeon]PMP75155.1 MAG: transcriptional regulator [Aciduliprofundum sp.]
MPRDLLKRKEIYETIEKNPGMHFRELQRRLNLNVGELQYHLDVLEKEQLIVSREEMGYRRYYPRALENPSEKKYLPFLRQPIARRILISLIENGGGNMETLERDLGLKKTTLNYHLKKLLSGNLVIKVEEGRNIIYRVVDEEEIARTIIKYRNSFQDTIVERFIDFWERS